MHTYNKLQIEKAAFHRQNTSSVLSGHKVHVANLKKERKKKHQLLTQYQAHLREAAKNFFLAHKAQNTNFEVH